MDFNALFVAQVNFRQTQVVVPRNKRPPSASADTAMQTKSTRYLPRSKQIGDWGEARAMRFIRERISGATDIVHREANNERPGWAMDYVDENGVRQRVEVKSTTAAAFSSIMLTGRELEAAQTYGANFTLMLIDSCETTSPKSELFRDPFRMIQSDEWGASPASYNVILSDDM